MRKFVSKSALFALFLSLLQLVNSQDLSPTLSDQSMHATDVNMIFDEEDVIVNPGNRLELKCGVEGKYRNCYWEKETGKIFQVEDVHDNLISGMSSPDKLNGNECGIVIDSAKVDDHGEWMCKIFIIGDALSKKKKVIVTISPTTPILEISNRPLIVDTSSEQTIMCSVAEARPRATINWYLGPEDITGSSDSETSLTNTNGIYKTVSTLRRQFQSSDNGKRLICSVKHYTLTEPTTDLVEVDVRFKPTPQDPVTFYEVKVDTDVDLSVNFTANPRPKSLVWNFGNSYDALDNTISVPGLDSEGRYTAMEVMSLPKEDMYSAILRINGFTEQDVDRKFSLTVENDLGRTDYKVMLSMGEAPRDEISSTDVHEILTLPENNEFQDTINESDSKSLSGGAVAAIIIVVLLVVLVVLVAGYARYHQMYCFATRAESKAYIQDPEHGSIGNSNDAVKASTDHVNGRTDVATVANGNGNMDSTRYDDSTIDDRKKNTDV